MSLSNLTSSIRGVSGNESITNLNKVQTVNLVVTNATLDTITNLKSINATVTNASIQKLKVLSASITEASIGTLKTRVYTPTNLTVVNASFTNASIQKLRAVSATVTNMIAVNATITGKFKSSSYANLTIASIWTASIENLKVTNAIPHLRGREASLTNASIQKLKVLNASINNASINKLKTNSMIMNAATITDLGASSLVASYINFTATRGSGGVGFRMNPDTKKIEVKRQGVSWKKAGVSTGWVQIDGYIDHPSHPNHQILPSTTNLNSTFFTINLGTFCATGARAVEISGIGTNSSAGKSIMYRKHGGSGTRNVLQTKAQVGGVAFYLNGRVEVSATKAIDIFATGGSELWSAFIINIRGSYV